MPTVAARYHLGRQAPPFAEEELVIESGAVLFKAGPRPVVVTLGEKGVSVRVGGGALALMSAFDGRPFVVNLTDRCCGSCVVELRGRAGRPLAVSVAPGELGEVVSGSPASGGLVGKGVVFRRQLADGHAFELYRLDYGRTLRRYRLSRWLPRQDLERVLKTAAALAFVRP